MLALVLARVVCINGGQRFRRPAPHWLFVVLGIREQWPPPAGQRDWAVGIALAGSQIPTLWLLTRLHVNSKDASVRLWNDLHYSVPMLLGLIFAALFWWLVDMTYHGTYPYHLFGRPARTLLYPRFLMFGLDALEHSRPPSGILYKDGLLYAAFRGFFALLARGGSGYRERTGPAAGQLYEGHRIAAIGLVGYVIVYALFYPLTAPAIVPRFGVLLLRAAVVISAVLLIDQLSLLTKGATWKTRLFFLLPLIVLGVCGYFLGRTWHIGHSPFVFFPVLASVLILLTLLCSLFAGMSFFLDRHRLPVLISFVLIFLLLPRLWIHGTGEHFFPAIAKPAPVLLPGPSSILAQRCSNAWANHKPCNMIFITATGGGIHAAVWTAGILSALEEDFATQLSNHPPFHQQLAFASTVSGGSVGFSDFLRRYPRQSALTSQLPQNAGPADFIEASNEAACSDLEAVSWGLIYSDFWHLVLPIPRHSPGLDRSHALEWALERNAVTPQCRWTADQRTHDVEKKALTIDDFALTPRTVSRYPAFTMNTTAVEKGGRFLLANYSNDSTLHGFAPAASFESVYAANLKLATAARLSATYPVVSSAARIVPTLGPEENGTRVAAAAHFVDGGYYDNDGLASAIEFLEEAYLNDKPPTQQPIRDPVNILVIEIRDGYDISSKVDEESAKSQATYPHPMDLSGQLDAPLEAFYNTGHVGVSRRNYIDLARLQKAMPSSVKLYAEVLPYDAPTPLSWQLTPKQRAEISGKIDGLHTQRNCIIAWEKWKSGEGPRSCQFPP